LLSTVRTSKEGSEGDAERGSVAGNASSVTLRLNNQGDLLLASKPIN
jgi:hypothetical protein